MDTDSFAPTPGPVLESSSLMRSQRRKQHRSTVHGSKVSKSNVCSVSAPARADTPHCRSPLRPRNGTATWARFEPPRTAITQRREQLAERVPSPAPGVASGVPALLLAVGAAGGCSSRGRSGCRCGCGSGKSDVRRPASCIPHRHLGAGAWHFASSPVPVWANVTDAGADTQQSSTGRRIL